MMGRSIARSIKEDGNLVRASAEAQLSCRRYTILDICANRIMMKMGFADLEALCTIGNGSVDAHSNRYQ